MLIPEPRLQRLDVDMFELFLLLDSSADLSLLLLPNVPVRESFRDLTVLSVKLFTIVMHGPGYFTVPWG